MRTDEFDIESSVAIGYGCYDPIVVAFDVEYDSTALENAGVPELGLDISRGLPVSLLNLVNPGQ